MSVRPDHFEHGFGRHLEIVAAPASACDRMCERGLIDPVLDKGLVDVDGNDFAERQPGLGVSAVRALELDDLRKPAFEGHWTFRYARHVDELAGRGCEPCDGKLVDVMGNM